MYLFQAYSLDQLLAALTDDQEGGTLIVCFQGNAVDAAGEVHILACNYLAQAVHERDRRAACGKGVERGCNDPAFDGEVDALGDGGCGKPSWVIFTIVVSVGVPIAGNICVIAIAGNTRVVAIAGTIRATTGNDRAIARSDGAVARNNRTAAGTFCRCVGARTATIW